MTDAQTSPETTLGSAPSDGADEAETTAAIVFLGDSLTASGDWAAWFPDRVIINAGVGGDTTADVFERLDAVTEARPGTVVLMAGTNDLKLRATVEQVVRGVENILVTLHRELPNTRLIVQSVLPRERERSEYVHQINIHLRQFAPTLKAEYLDLAPAFADEDGELKSEFTEDRLHLNDAGYATWVDQLRQIL